MEPLISDILSRVRACPSEVVVNLVQRERRALLKGRFLGDAHWLSPECLMLCSLRSAAGVSFADSVPVYNQLRREYERSSRTIALGEVTLATAETAWRTQWYPAWTCLRIERESLVAARNEVPKSHFFADWYVVFIPERGMDKHFAKLSLEKQLAIVIRRGGMGNVLSNLTKPMNLDRQQLAGRVLAVVCADLDLARMLVSHPSRSGKFSVYRTDWVRACDLKQKVLSARAYAHREPLASEKHLCTFEAERVASDRTADTPLGVGHLGEQRCTMRNSSPDAPAVKRAIHFLPPMEEHHSPVRKRPRVDPSKFFCQKAEAVEPGLSQLFPNNSLICEALSQLATHWEVYCRKVPTAPFKVRGYRAAMNYVKKLTYDLSTVEDVRRLVADKSVRMIGSGIGARLEEIVITGSLAEARGLHNSPTFSAIRELTGVWGVGPVRAGELVLRSIDSVATLRKRITTDSTLLDRQQTIGLRHYEDLLQRIPRSEVAKIEEYVRRIVEECMPHEPIKVEVAGSYLRGAQTCGDVDVMLVGVRDVVSKGLETIVRRMCEAGTVTDALMLSSNKFFGVFRLGPGMAHRRLDLFAVPSEEYAFALLTYTGSGQFNRSMRCLAGRMGYTLSHKGLHHAKKTKTGHIKCGPSISCDTEQEIFEHLGMQYVMPTARGKSS